MAVIEQALEGKFKNRQVADLLHCVNRNVVVVAFDNVVQYKLSIQILLRLYCK